MRNKKTMNGKNGMNAKSNKRERESAANEPIPAHQVRC
jgi:hypothetical protein